MHPSSATPIEPGEFAYVDGGGDHLLGQFVTNIEPTTKQTRVAVVVRNKTGAALLPKMVVNWSTTAGKYLKEITTYSFKSDTEWAGVVDDQLPASGVPNNGIFLLYVKGPVKVNKRDGDYATAVSIGDLMCNVTAAGSTAATTAIGRADKFSANAGTTSGVATAVSQLTGVLGRAMSAQVTNTTASDIMVNLCRVI